MRQLGNVLQNYALPNDLMELLNYCKRWKKSQRFDWAMLEQREGHEIRVLREKINCFNSVNETKFWALRKHGKKAYSLSGIVILRYHRLRPRVKEMNIITQQILPDIVYFRPISQICVG